MPDDTDLRAEKVARVKELLRIWDEAPCNGKLSIEAYEAHCELRDMAPELARILVDNETKATRSDEALLREARKVLDDSAFLIRVNGVTFKDMERGRGQIERTIAKIDAALNPPGAE